MKQTFFAIACLVGAFVISNKEDALHEPTKWMLVTVLALKTVTFLYKRIAERT